MNQLVGYYDRADQDQPTYDPPHDGPCIICWKPLTPDTVRTINVMAMPDARPARSYFYRLHRACHDRLTPEEQGALDHSVLGPTHTEWAPCAVPLCQYPHKKWRHGCD
jgi:hypothetical protein